MMKNVNKWFEKTHALKNVNIVVNEGETVGLIGDNGAGKSTLIKILAGVTSMDKGEIYWKGKKVEIRSVKDARRLGIETVFQERGLIDSFSLSKNVFLGREPTKRTMLFRIMDYEKMRDETTKLIERLHLRIKSDQEARFCSGGEKQGIVIARSMYFKAKLINLDEPTRALSVRGVESVHDFINKLRMENIACIFITHNLHHVYPIADRFIILDRGEKVMDVKKNKIKSERKLESSIIEATLR